MTQLRTFSYGGGVQSTACLILAAQGRIDYQTFLFANVGDDSEHPDTLTYVREIAIPYALHKGLSLIELDRRPVRGKFKGKTLTLFERIMDDEKGYPAIPVKLYPEGAPAARDCTLEFKIRVIGLWLKAHGASATNPAHIGIGISLDESWRANKRRAQDYEESHYPLLDMDPPMRRTDCEAVIRREPLPEALAAHLVSIVDALPPVTREDLYANGFKYMPRPPKSACWFCPFHKRTDWEEMKRDRPDLYERACALEDTINERRTARGGPPVYMLNQLIPLRDLSAAQRTLFDVDDVDTDAQCDNGVCFL